MIKAITFDLWDTVIQDNSDEPKRKAQGLRSKHDERRHMVWQALNEQQPIDSAQVELAYDVGEAAFRHVWHDQFVTWTVAERIAVVLDGLGRTLPQAAFDDIVARHEEMETTVAPDPIDGAREAIAELAQRYKLSVVSDAIVAPGRCLRDWLDMHDLKTHFSGFAFSDEIGHSKPHRDMFASVASHMDVGLEEMVHIGDRDHNDIKGAHALGMKAILFTATRGNDRDITTADAICERYSDLPGIVDRLAGKTA